MAFTCRAAHSATSLLTNLPLRASRATPARFLPAPNLSLTRRQLFRAFAASRIPGSKAFSQSRCASLVVLASDRPAAAEEMKTVLVPIADGSEEMEAVIAIDVLRRAGADVTVASVEPQLQVTASRQVKLVADNLISEVSGNAFDLIVLPGGMPGAERLRDSAELKALVEKQNAAKKEVAAICAAPVVALADWGLLKDKKATAHPNFSGKLSDTSAAEQRVVEDGNVTTSRGPGTAFEFSLKLVERLFGSEKADGVAKPMVMPTGDDRWRLEVGQAAAGLAKGKSAKVLVPIANGTEEMEAIIVIDVLRRAGATVVVASVEDTLEIVASRKVKMVADASIKEAMMEHYDLVVLPGGMPGAERLRDSPELDAILQAQAKADQPYAAICASPVVALQPKGLLSGKKATAHPAFSEKLPDQDAAGVRVVRDGLVVTSRGPGTAFEFSLALVELLFGAEAAAAVAAPMVMVETPKVAAA